MRLVITELRNAPLPLGILIDHNVLIERFRLHLAKYLHPTGMLHLTVTNNYGEIVETVSLDMTEMEALGSDNIREDYYHGYVSFKPARAFYLQKGFYILELSATGYTYSNSEFIGWCRDWDDPALKGAAPTIIEYPLGLEPYTFTVA